MIKDERIGSIVYYSSVKNGVVNAKHVFFVRVSKCYNIRNNKYYNYYYYHYYYSNYDYKCTMVV